MSRKRYKRQFVAMGNIYNCIPLVWACIKFESKMEKQERTSTMEKQERTSTKTRTLDLKTQKQISLTCPVLNK